MKPKLNVIITGTTGMVGEGILQECILNQNIGHILLISRRSSGYHHPKVEEILHEDLADISALSLRIKGYDACYFCLGVSALSVSEQEYIKVTFDLTLGFAKTLIQINPEITFCYVSGRGTDSSMKGKQMWARVKGMTENELIKLSMRTYNFRPAFMNPSPGAKNVKGIYRFINTLFPFLRLFSKTYFLTLEEVGKAMIQVSLNGYYKQIIEIEDIAQLSTQYKK